MQAMEVQKSNTDHVVVTIDQPNPKLKQSPQADPNISIPQPLSSAKTLRRLNFSKPRSRFEEIKYPLPPKTIHESEQLQPLNPYQDNNSSTDEEDDEDWYENEEDEEENNDDKQGKHLKRRKRKINKRAVIEWTLFLIIMTCLVCSLRLDSLKNNVKWGLEIWKWCVMVMVMFCGRLVSGWVVGFLVFIIERNFMLREKVLYFVFGLRKSFQNCAWLGLVLVAWMIMFPDKHNKVLKKIFCALIAVLIGATIWLLKIFPIWASTRRGRKGASTASFSGVEVVPARLRDKSHAVSRSYRREGSRRIDMEKLRRLSMASRATAWSVKRLVNYVRSSGLSTISRTIDDFGNAESEITSEWEARNSAQRIFKNVAKPGAK
ncbi:hypothetical protein ACFX2F_028210 [Malus domestica]